MYYPYFRGKQFELIAIRDTAQILAESGFTPIIEPVKPELSGLERTLDALVNAGGNAIVVVNPHYGEHKQDGIGISQMLSLKFRGNKNIAAGILLKSGTTFQDAINCYEKHSSHPTTFIHAGFTEAKALADWLGGRLPSSEHIFISANCGIPYWKHFKGSKRILVRDGFERQRNADYPPLEYFSYLHTTFQEEGMDGFGDFLTVGDIFTEGGGPAYAVAIHLTFIDKDKDDQMFIYHFVSTTKDTPTDTAGKFGQALSKLINKLNSGNSHLLETSAISEFRDLHSKGHFSGLGQVKKLSMKHHIETLANYFSK